jgi:GGDEF domain-containing protein
MFWCRRFFHVLLWTALLPLQAFALTATSQASVTVQISAYLNGDPQANLTIAQIAAKPVANFTGFNSEVAYPTDLQKHIWLKLRVTSQQELYADAWLVGISKAFVDTVILHTRSKDGTWLSQSAGDRLEHRLWPVRSLAPQFFVPAQPAGSQDMYLEVRNRTPLRFDVTSQSAVAAAVKAQNNFFLIGLAIGLMLLMVIASIVLALTHRHMAYAWYGVYVMTNMLVCIAYSGVGSYALWPDAKVWPELSITLLYMLGNVLQLLFCRAMFFTHHTPNWARRLVLCVLALGVMSIALNIYAIANLGSSLVFTLHVLVISSLSFFIIVSQFSRKSPASWLYLLSCLPLTIVGLLAVLEHSGWMVLVWLPYNAPIYAFALEMPVLFAAIYVHAKAQHAESVRQSTLASTDPATGFISTSNHMGTFEKLWNEAQDTRRDLVVVYVQVSHQHSPMMTLGSLQSHSRSVERAVRLIRTVVREQDTVTHAGTDLFAVFMPELSIGESLTNRLARLVALAVMTDQDETLHVPIRFRVVASSTLSFQGSAAKLHATLQGKFNQADWGQRAIRYVRNFSGQDRRAVSSQPDETLSQFWDRAASQEVTARSAKSTLQLDQTGAS